MTGGASFGRPGEVVAIGDHSSSCRCDLFEDTRRPRAGNAAATAAAPSYDFVRRAVRSKVCSNGRRCAAPIPGSRVIAHDRFDLAIIRSGSGNSLITRE